MVRGVYTLEGVSYRDEFGRRGSLELHHLIPALAEEVRTSIYCSIHSIVWFVSLHES